MADATKVISLIIGAEDQASDKLQTIGDTAKKMGETMVVAGGAIVGALGLALKSYDDSVKVQNQLTAALQSTHGAAGLYIEDLNDQSAALQKLTTYSDEAIGSAQALLLTFTNVKGPIFQEATGVILDMSTALGQDLKSSTIQLGKALNDPIKGITALSRVGVSFSQQQKDVIQKLVDTGQSAKAQQVILDELNKEFGGSAQAAVKSFSGEMANLKNQFDDFMEVVGSKILPVLEKFLDDYVRPIIEKLQEWIAKNPELASKIILIVGAAGLLLTVVGGLLVVFGALVTAISAITIASLILVGWIALIVAALVILGIGIYEIIKHWQDIKEFTLAIWQDILNFFKKVWDDIKNYVKSSIDSVKNSAIQGWNDIKNAASAIWQAVTKAIYNELFGTLTAFVDTWNNIKNSLTSTWNGLSDSAKGWIKLLGVILTLGLLEIVFLIINNWQTISDFLTKTWAAITAAATKWVNDLKTMFTLVWNAISVFFTTIWNAISTNTTKTWTEISTFLTTIWEAINKLAVAVWTPLSQFFSDKMNEIKKIFSTLWSGIKDDTATIWNDIKNIVGAALDWLNQKIQAVINAYNQIKSAISSPINAIGGALGSAGNALNNAFSGRAAGGPVFGGTTYLVGERGPELFTPSQTGFITPNGSLAAAGGGSSVTINITGNTLLDPNAAEKIGDMIMRKLKFKNKI